MGKNYRLVKAEFLKYAFMLVPARAAYVWLELAERGADRTIHRRRQPVHGSPSCVTHDPRAATCRCREVSLLFLRYFFDAFEQTVVYPV